MAPHTRLLSNNNDSDLLEISGGTRCQWKGDSGSRRLFTTTQRHNRPTKPGAHSALRRRREEEKKDIKHIFALEESGVFPPPAPTVVPCQPPPTPSHPLSKRQQQWRRRSIGIQRLRYLRKQSLLNILTAVCSVSRGHASYTGGL